MAAATALGLGLLTWASGPAAAEDAFPAPASHSGGAKPISPQPTSPEPVAAGLIVEYAPGTPAREAPGVPTGASSVTVTDLEIGRNVDGVLRTVAFADAEPAAIAKLAAAQLERDPDVLFAEPDWIVSLDEVAPSAFPPAVQASPPWGLDRIDQRLGLNGAYDYGTAGAGVTAYIVDTGLLSSHVDFTGRVMPGFSAFSDGWGTEDCHGHGTHVGGTVGGTTYGVAKAVTLVPVKVLNCGGSGTDSTVIAGLRWILDNHPVGRPAVVNMSLGGGVSDSLDAAVRDVYGAGITVVVAAGNDGARSCESSPAREPLAITVNASTRTDDDASWSNYGSCSDIYAPGVDIPSAHIASATAAIELSGTSMAAPHVAGVAARLLQSHPSYLPAQVWAALDASSTYVNFGLASFGDPNKLLYIDPWEGAVQPPSAVAVTPAVEALRVTWAAPVSSTPIYYDVQYSDDSITWISDDSVASTSTTIDSLTTATPYLVRVRSATADDSSTWVVAGPASALPPTVPGTPLSLAIAVDDSALGISWTVPASTGGRPVLHYEVEHTSDDTTWVVDDTTTSTVTAIPNLTNGVPYRVRIRAVNVIGAGAWQTSATTYAPRTLVVPTAPRSVSAIGGDASIAVSWAAPADTGGRPIMSYAVERSTDDSTWIPTGSVTSNSTALTGLANGTAYSVRVAAITVVGRGPWAQTSATPIAPPPPPPPPSSGGGGGGGAPPPPPAPVLTAPGAPLITSTVPGDRTISANWVASDDTGGEVPSGFTVELEGSGTTVSKEILGATTTFTELANGTAYRLRVAAVNSAGAGAWSPWTTPITPRGPASAPRSLMVVAGDSSAKLSWAPPDSDGGSPTAGYVVEVTSSGATQEFSVTYTSTSLVGLSNDRTYSIRVAAVTEAGSGEWSPPVSVTPRALRVSAPNAVAATRTALRVSVSWEPPRQGLPLRYVVTASINGNPYRVADSTRATRVSFTVASTARTIRVQVFAVDTYGQGPKSAPVQPRSR